MKELLFATTNRDKVSEAQEILPVPVKIADIEIDEVQSKGPLPDLEYIAKKKAEAAYAIVHEPVFVDDVSLEIEAWYDLPGPFIKFFQQAGGSRDNNKFLEIVRHVSNRRVKVLCAIAYHDGNKARAFTGEFNGTLATEERGTDGWGFDFIVIPNGETQTFAELGPEKKNKISHRRKALDKFKDYLDSQK